VLFGVKNAKAYLDDILIWDVSFEDCLSTTREVLGRLERHNIRINADKCCWFEPRVEYLGHILDLEGYHPARSQVEAILDAAPPKNATQVRAYAGMLNHYGKFLPHFSRDLKPLFDLTSKGAAFVWTTACQEAFELSKKKLLSHQLLVPFDGNRKILVSSDASPYGVGCVIAHEFVETLPSGQTRVVEKPGTNPGTRIIEETWKIQKGATSLNTTSLTSLVTTFRITQKSQSHHCPAHHYGDKNSFSRAFIQMCYFPQVSLTWAWLLKLL